MIRARGSQAILEDVSRIEEELPAPDEDTQVGIVPVAMSIGVILLLNLAEIGYFIYCVYLFNDYAVIIGSSVLVGYSLYSMVKFLPKVKKFIKKPIRLLMERTEGYENILNILMASIEVLFCAYILFRIIILNFKG